MPLNSPKKENKKKTQLVVVLGTKEIELVHTQSLAPNPTTHTPQISQHSKGLHFFLVHQKKKAIFGPIKLQIIT